MMANYDNNAYKNDGARIQEFKKWQQIPDTTIEAMENFMYWYENEFDFGDWSDVEVDVEIASMRRLFDEFLHQGRLMEQHKIAEQRLLKIWTNSCKGE
jgi:hypothetical protein